MGSCASKCGDRYDGSTCANDIDKCAVTECDNRDYHIVSLHTLMCALIDVCFD